MIEFSNIPSSINYRPLSIKADLSSIHSTMITAFIEAGDYRRAKRKQIIIALNIVSHLFVNHDSLPDGWIPTDPLTNMKMVSSADIDIMKDDLGAMYIRYENIDWSDIDRRQSDMEAAESIKPVSNIRMSVNGEDVQIPSNICKSTSEDTPKEDLWLKPRDVPRYIPSDTDAWRRMSKDGKVYTIFKSYPLIPTRQRDITITTDVDRMADSAIDKLFPNQFIRTRKPCMYEPVDGVYMHEKLGLIPDIEGFTREQVIENVIQYPHLYIIRRVVDGAVKNFFADIEIDGVLHPIIDVWDTLPDTRILPKTKEFMQEYVIRRYLLERDIKHVEHKYPMDCDLNPYLTLFMPKNEYAQYGFTGIGRLHVKSRVAYLQSLNPILRSLYQPNPSVCVTECPFADQCTDQVCDGSCPKQAEFTYLLERNRIDLRSSVFQTSEAKIELAKSVLHTDKRLIVVESETTIDTSNLLTYIACCEKWRGNCLNCSVYHLNFSAHLDMEQQSWSMKTLSESFEYEKIWMDYAPILIISNFDYIQFKDFQAQTLLNLIHSRERDCKTTIIVSPKINNLVGKGQFFDLLKGKLREAVIR